MNKKGQDAMGLAVFAIVAMVGAAILWNVVQDATVPPTVTREQFTWGANGSTHSLANDNLNSLTITKGGATLNNTHQFIQNLDAGTVKLIINKYNNTKANATYEYNSDTTITNPIAKIVVGFLVIMFILGVMTIIANKSNG